MITTALSRFLPPLARLRNARDTLLAERDALSLALTEAALREQALHRELEAWRDLDRSRFHHLNSVFDPVAIIRRHAVPAPASRAGLLVNFLDVAIDPKVLPHVLAGRGGEVEGPPIPANWHADVAEWAAVLRAVELAGGPGFTAVELGCGWGCWLNNAGAAARRAGRDVRLVGVEGDAGHLEFAREMLAVNGFAPRDWTLIGGVAAASGGTALFPRQARAGEDWSLQPRFGVSPEEVRVATGSGAWDAVAMRPLAAVLPADGVCDLLHLDIQGGEAELIENSVSILAERVAYLVVGTHGRSIEGRLVAALGSAGFTLEVDRPAFLAPPDLLGPAAVDGVQGWRNRRLLS